MRNLNYPDTIKNNTIETDSLSSSWNVLGETFLLLFQKVKKATRGAAATLYLAVTFWEELIENQKVEDYLCENDHEMITFTILRKNSESSRIRTIDWGEAEFNKLRELVSRIS